MKVSKILLAIAVMFFLASCTPSEKKTALKTETETEVLQPKFKTSDEIVEWLKNPNDDYVAVVAHRGDWRNAPENSLQSIKNCIKIGVDIVEVDVRLTKDGKWILIHDNTLDRTTTGKGKVSDYTLEDIQGLNLKNGAGSKTTHKISTLDEVLHFIQGKPILINLDSKEWDLPTTFQLLKKTQTVNQVIFKWADPLPVMRERWGAYMDSILFMPMIYPIDYKYKERFKLYVNNNIKSSYEFAQNYFEGFSPLAFEVIYDREDSPVFKSIDYIRKEKNVPVWVNSLWADLNAGHYDDIAINDPDAHWGWIIEHGANIIQTDRPYNLIEYLESKGFRD